MKLGTLALLGMVFGGLVFPSQSQPAHNATPPRTKVFLLQDAKHHQWCAYSSEPAWRTDVDAIGAMNVAVLTYKNMRLSSIDLTQSDETGDWITYDTYGVDQLGQLAKLARTSNVAASDRAIVERYSITDGHARRTSIKKTRLYTDEAVKLSDQEWVPDIPVKTSLDAFPFHAHFHLLQPKNKICLRGGDP